MTLECNLFLFPVIIFNKHFKDQENNIELAVNLFNHFLQK